MAQRRNSRGKPKRVNPKPERLGGRYPLPTGGQFGRLWTVDQASTGTSGRVVSDYRAGGRRDVAVEQQDEQSGRAEMIDDAGTGALPLDMFSGYKVRLDGLIAHMLCHALVILS